jgi:WD40 repeat protein/serine/threonine protein kinase
MSEPTCDRDPFEVVAEAFLARYRAGKRPSIEAYAELHPELAEQIRRLMPALVAVEQDLSIDSDTAMRPAGASTRERRLGDYRILRELGRGGMGVVYEAEQVSLGRHVALKVLPPQIAHDRKALERFRREAKAAARLHHTNIVPVFEVGQDGESVYFAMQFIQGQGLDQVIDELARLRDRGRDRAMVNPARTVGATATGPGEPTLGRAAELLLSGRLATECAVPLTGDTPAPDLAAATEGFAPDADPDPSPANVGGDGFAAVAAGPQPASAVFPGGGQIAPTALSGQGRLFFQGVAQIGRQAAQALAFAHARRIIHRDVKPSNLLLDHAGVVWIADFGLAKGEDDGLTTTGDILGTLRYMAPERFRGEGDARADIYALGLTLYELLTLRPALDSPDRLELIERIKSEEPPRPRSLDGRIPRDLETIVLKAIEKDARQRYQSAEALAEDLRRFLADEPIQARRSSAAERYWRWSRRNPIIAVMGGLLTIVLILGTIVSTYFALWASQKAKEAEGNAFLATREMLRANQEARKALDEAARADQEARRARDEKRLSDHRLYAAEMNAARQAWVEGQTELVRQHLEAFEVKGTEEPDLRGFEWYYLRRSCQWELTRRGGSCVAFSPDGTRIAAGSKDGTVRVCDAASGREVQTLRGNEGGVNAVTFSPDGRILASAGHDHTVRLWETATGREVEILRGHTSAVLSISYRSDGHALASGGEDGTVRVWDTATNREVRILRAHASAVRGVAYGPDGHTLASGQEKTVMLWDAETGRLLRTFGGHSATVWAVVYSPDGRTIASAGRSPDRTVRLWDVATGQTRLTLRGHAAGVIGLAFSPDGRILASTSTDRSMRFWDTVKGQEIRAPLSHETDVWGVAFSPDGRRIASASKDEIVRIRDITTDQQGITLSGHTDRPLGVSYSPDGRTVASGGYDRTVRVWGVATAKEVNILRGHASAVWDVSHSPDGRTLASASHDHTVKLWDVSSFRERATLRSHTAKLFAVSFGPDGRTLASAGEDRTVRVWDALAGRVLHVLRGHTDQVNDVAFSPDGRTIASAGHDHTIMLWDAVMGREEAVLRGHTAPVLAVAYSPDGRTLVSSGVDGTVRLWDIGTGREVHTLRGHPTSVQGVAYSPDGRSLASASSDMTVKVWDSSTGQELLTLRGHLGPVFGVSFSPDSRILASTSFDLTARLWDARPLTSGLRANREARQVVEALFARSLATADVMTRILSDATLGPGIGELALDMVPPYGESRMTQHAERLVESLYAQAKFRPEVLEILGGDAKLDDEVRRRALMLAEQVPERPESLDEAGRAVVRRPGAEPSAYRSALRRAEAACRLVPDEGDFLNTRGIAEYRLGLYRQAVGTLTLARRSHEDNWNGQSYPPDLAFLAMSRYRLGQPEQARADMGRLRETMKTLQWAPSEESQAFLREAEALERDVVFPTDPFGPQAGNPP